MSDQDQVLLPGSTRNELADADSVGKVGADCPVFIAR